LGARQSRGQAKEEWKNPMKFTIERNWIDVLGVIWMPAATCGQRITLSAYDIANIGEPTRDNVLDWLGSHAGDFQSITDFHAVIGELELPWESEDNEYTYHDCMDPE
jgi:hypothetical protein